MPGKNKRTKHWSTRQHFLSEMERKGRRFIMSEEQQADRRSLTRSSQPRPVEKTALPPILHSGRSRTRR
jgi:hypothetical protein